MTYQDIPQLIQGGGYEVNIHLPFLIDTVQKWENEPHYKLQMIPDFQRGHVWTSEQQSAFMEYFIQGGRSGMVIYFNKPSWQNSIDPINGYDEFVVVDGLQRLTAIIGFLKDKVLAFSQKCSDFGSLNRMRNCDALRFNVNNLKTKEAVLRWYLQMNAGGTPHSESEISRVRAMLKLEQSKP